MPLVMERIENVRALRLNSKSASTREIAKTPTHFHVENIPSDTYLLIPSVSSERRTYVPLGFMPPSMIPSNLVLVIRNASLYHFGVLTSLMHMTWMRAVAGRLKSDYRYSSKIVYNNFPWPTDAPADNRQKVEQSAQAVLDTRKKYPSATLADLYDPNTMPEDLLKAHQALDRAVDKCYRPKTFADEHERISFLFELYEKMTG